MKRALSMIRAYLQRHFATFRCGVLLDGLHRSDGSTNRSTMNRKDPSRRDLFYSREATTVRRYRAQQRAAMSEPFAVIRATSKDLLAPHLDFHCDCNATPTATRFSRRRPSSDGKRVIGESLKSDGVLMKSCWRCEYASRWTTPASLHKNDPLGLPISLTEHQHGLPDSLPGQGWSSKSRGWGI